MCGDKISFTYDDWNTHQYSIEEQAVKQYLWYLYYYTPTSSSLINSVKQLTQMITKYCQHHTFHIASITAIKILDEYMMQRNNNKK